MHTRTFVNVTSGVRRVEMKYARYTHHKRFEVRTPPLGETITDFPIIIDPVRGIELARVTGWGQAFVQTALEALEFVFAGF